MKTEYKKVSDFLELTNPEVINEFEMIELKGGLASALYTGHSCTGAGTECIDVGNNCKNAGETCSPQTGDKCKGAGGNCFVVPSPKPFPDLPPIIYNK